MKTIEIEDWQKKILKEMPDKIIINCRRWSGKRNYYKALEEKIKKCLIQLEGGIFNNGNNKS